MPSVKEHITETAFVTLLAGVGSILLTFLAGAEIDPVSLRRHWRASISIPPRSCAYGPAVFNLLCNLTPFFLLHAGTLISAPALVSGAGVIAALLLVKLGTKLLGVWPIATIFGLPRRERRLHDAAYGDETDFGLYLCAVRLHPRIYRQDSCGSRSRRPPAPGYPSFEDLG